MNDIWHITLFNIQGSPVNLIKILSFIVIIILGYVVGALLRRGIQKAFSIRNYSASSGYTIGRFAYLLVVIMGFYCGLTFLGINLTGIAVIAGALSVGIGFGLQAILSNFVSGLLILFEKNMTLGDVIQLESGTIGKVIKINIRSTLIQIAGQKKMVIPNTEMISKKLVLWSHAKRGKVQWRVLFTTKRDVDREKIKTIAEQAIGKECFIHLMEVSESFQQWEVLGWTEPKKEAISFLEISDLLETAFKKEGISIEKISSPHSFFT